MPRHLATSCNHSHSFDCIFRLCRKLASAGLKEKRKKKPSSRQNQSIHHPPTRLESFSHEDTDQQPLTPFVASASSLSLSLCRLVLPYLAPGVPSDLFPLAVLSKLWNSPGDSTLGEYYKSCFGRSLPPTYSLFFAPEHREAAKQGGAQIGPLPPPTRKIFDIHISVSHVARRGEEENFHATYIQYG